MWKIMMTMLIFSQPLHSNALEVEEDLHIQLQRGEISQYGMNYLDSLFIDQKKLEYLMNDLNKKIYKQPVNAKYADNGAIIPEKPGITLDRSEFESLFKQLYYSNKDNDIKIPVAPVHAKVDSGLLQEISVRELGSYATFYRETNKERSYNIALAAEAINNTVVFPGGTFSFNDTVGQRTPERGYKKAPVIVRGELSEDIGGGICQVSSTLFNAVDLKGIQIIERYAHSRRVPYVPSGRDATVSWWGPDFVFKNLYNEPILIRAKAVNGRMIVAIYTSETAEYFTGKSK
ncbi:hypothetical protein D8M04_09830 [Oceanobacillus piezotolerans]|uniref:Uncharacterized protein n=1 Tax=Oceanobacillus piezotolerans TaxID=2448030 RepID=A0A498DN32_9BACI|nr:VanW family protein [Oceanobacillus piezotolerans]RLL45152.1 hypothetical protein D8M04_09830 [Oceanobacillus piezotolerans]